jgi:Icc protein
MPILIDRRRFMSAAAAGLMAGKLTAQTDRVRWALLSDTHIPEDFADAYRGFRPAENLKIAVRDAAAVAMDGYLVNGDLARQFGREGDYRRFSELIAPFTAKAPAALTLGNHDDRAHAEAAFQSTAGVKAAVSDKWVSVVETGPLRFVLLDSLFQTNLAAGLLGKSQRDWLDSWLLANAGKPTVVFVHHTLDDSDGSLLDADRFLNIVTSHRHVKAVFYGHSHAYRYDVRDGLHLVNLPAVGYNFADGEPVGWVEAELSGKGARLTLHAIGGNRALDGQSRGLEWR